MFNAHGDVVGYTGGEVPETGNPCEFYVMDEEGFPVCHSASENAALRQQLADVTESMGRVEERCAKLRELVREMYAAIDMADYVHDFDDPMHFMFVDDMRELGVEVKDD